MLHEVLLALSGYPGSLFVRADDGSYRVIQDVTFLHPSEVAVLNERLCKLIGYHQFVLDFVERHGRARPLSQILAECDGDDKPRGLYLQALCRGLEKILDGYRGSLIQLEQEVLRDPHLPLTHLCTSLDEYRVCFPPLVALLNEIDRRRVRGCHLLDVVHASVASSSAPFHREIRKLLRYCHAVMYRQTATWLLYGLLADPYEEFFIQRANVSENDAGENEADACPQLLNGEHFMQPDMLPTYVPVALAEKICFVGESVRLLERKDRRVDELAAKRFGALPNRHELSLRFLSLQDDAEFDLQKFEAIVDELRASVAEQLWKLVMEGVGLAWHLKIAKDFFLLGRGELFQVFIERAGDVLQLPVTVTTERNVGSSFRAAARSVLLEDDATLDKFRVAIDAERSGADEAAKGGSEVGWNVIGLGFDVSWPLHIVFTKNVLEKYNAVFRFLLFVKHVQLEIQRCWTLQMQWKGRQMDVGYLPAWRLRTLMSFVVSNIQYYLQVDVLESLHGVLVERVEKTHDFEAIQLAHEQFVANLLAQTFLSSKVIATCITELLDLCLGFGRQYAAAARGRVPFPSAAFAANVADMQKQFSNKASFLFQVLSSTQTYQATPFVEQLVMRLDFNNYFSNGQLTA